MPFPDLLRSLVSLFPLTLSSRRLRRWVHVLWKCNPLHSRSSARSRTSETLGDAPLQADLAHSSSILTSQTRPPSAQPNSTIGIQLRHPLAQVPPQKNPAPAPTTTTTVPMAVIPPLSFGSLLASIQRLTLQSSEHLSRSMRGLRPTVQPHSIARFPCHLAGWAGRNRCSTESTSPLRTTAWSTKVRLCPSGGIGPATTTWAHNSLSVTSKSSTSLQKRHPNPTILQNSEAYCEGALVSICRHLVRVLLPDHRPPYPLPYTPSHAV